MKYNYGQGKGFEICVRALPSVLRPLYPMIGLRCRLTHFLHVLVLIVNVVVHFFN